MQPNLSEIRRPDPLLPRLQGCMFDIDFAFGQRACTSQGAMCLIIPLLPGVLSGRSITTRLSYRKGSGGFSMMAFKLALVAGCKVIITSSSDEKLQHVRQMARKGVVQMINCRTVPAWENEAISLNGGRGVDIVIENGGTSTLMQSLKAVVKGGTISQVGYLGKQDPADLVGFISLLVDKTVHLRGINVGSRRDFEEMNKLICATGLRFEGIIHKAFPINQIQEAFDVLQSGTHVGKVVVKLI
ncbi:hypothetical protein LTR27_005144 [Elasticomyces elasticus]|nr:hypothetical protein LTR27_005144 [Elasticomyces elasticus]